MKNYTVPYLHTVRELTAAGHTREEAAAPLNEGLDLIGHGLAELVECVPFGDYPILVALLQATADALTARMPESNRKLTALIRQTISTVVVRTRDDGRQSGGDGHG